MRITLWLLSPLFRLTAMLFQSELTRCYNELDSVRRELTIMTRERDLLAAITVRDRERVMAETAIASRNTAAAQSDPNYRRQ